MKSVLKILLYLTAGLLVLILISGISMYTYYGVKSNRNMSKTTDEEPALKPDSQVFHTLNKNGQLDVYEDCRQPADARVAALLGQMTLAEKAGMMVHPPIFLTDDGWSFKRPDMSNKLSLMGQSNSELIVDTI